jgi:hypothetical protein
MLTIIIIFIYTNPWRKTNHFIIIGFFLPTSLLHHIVRGNLERLASVYTMSFLSVMSLFAIGNMVLKYKRGTLRRTIYASWPHVVLGLLLVLIGLIGEIILNLTDIAYFLLYFGITFLIVMLMFSRNRVLKLLIKICHVYENENEIPSMLETNVKFLDKQYPKMCIDLVSNSLDFFCCWKIYLVELF